MDAPSTFSLTTLAKHLKITCWQAGPVQEQETFTGKSCMGAGERPACRFPSQWCCLLNGRHITNLGPFLTPIAEAALSPWNGLILSGAKTLNEYTPFVTRLCCFISIKLCVYVCVSVYVPDLLTCR